MVLSLGLGLGFGYQNQDTRWHVGLDVEKGGGAQRSFSSEKTVWLKKFFG